MSFGIEGLHMCIIEHYLLQAKLFKVFQNTKQNMMGSTKGVREERIQRRHHDHSTEDDEPSKRDPDMKVKILQARMNMF